MSLFKQNFLDKDQKDTIISTALIVVIALVLSVMLNLDRFMVLIVLPLQFLVTYVMFANKTIKKKGMFIESVSGKKFSPSTCEKLRLMTTVSLIPCFFVVFGSGKLKISEYILIFLPLFLTRTFIFVSKLPLSSLYSLTYTHSPTNVMNSLRTFNDSTIHYTRPTELKDDRYDPAYSFKGDNIFHNNRNH